MISHIFSEMANWLQQDIDSQMGTVYSAEEAIIAKSVEENCLPMIYYCAIN